MTSFAPALLSPAPCCGTLVTADGRTLPLRRTRLVVRAAGGFAQVRLVQTFANPHREPLHVRYQLPLPADAAVSGFEFRLGDLRVVGEIDRRSSARERFEQALANGRTAALLEQDRSSLFTQELGNLPPGAEVEATVDVDQPLAWVDGSWQWRFPTTAGPRYFGEVSRTEEHRTEAHRGDGVERIDVDMLDPEGATAPPRCELELAIADALTGGALPYSNSHALQATPQAGGASVVFAAAGGRVAMDRDVVISWPVAAPQVGVSLHTFRPTDGALAGQAFGLLTLMPPANAATAERLARDLIVLLDISGSMSGAPLGQAKAVTAALIDSLDAEDRLELIAFASRPQPWEKGARPASPENRADALRWLSSLRAGGGTEMHRAILAALKATRTDAQRQVVIVTDGSIGAEREVVAAIRNGLPAHCRVHVVGVGSAPHRTLTRGASRAGRGLEVLIGLDESPVSAVQRLLARTRAPLLDELELNGSLVLARAPHALPDLFAGAPTRLLLQLDPSGGTLHVRAHGASGVFTQTLTLPAIAAGGEALIGRSYAREAVEDLEVELAAGGDARGVEARIEALGLRHRISTRLTSWIAVSAEATVDPRAPQRRDVVRHELPYGMVADQLGLRAANPSWRSTGSVVREGGRATFSQGRMQAAMDHEPMACASELEAPTSRVSRRGIARDENGGALPPPSKKASFFGRLFGRRGGAGDEERDAKPAPQSLRAKLRLRTADEWVLEVLGLTAWDAPVRATVVLVDGSEHELQVDATRTTARGPLPAGALVKLVLVAALSGAALPAGRPARLRLVIAGATLDVPIA
jgi:Ca-activated chloride channel family protein